MRYRDVGAVLAVGMSLGLAGCHPANARTHPTAEVVPAAQQQAGPAAPDFPATLQWLNTDRPLTLRDLRGKVVLLDFWTYCCINCMHIIPDLKRLEAKYPNELVVIGVHSAKFTNEKDTDNIRQAILRYDLTHPVINDRDYLVWRAYGVDAWPTLVLIAPDGTVVGGASGEGHTAEIDRAIGSLVKQYGATGMLNRTPMHFALEKENHPKSLLSYPGKICGDAASSRLFFTDSDHNRVVITSLTGVVQQVIGSGEIGLQDGDFAAARFYRPQGIAFDSKHNALYVADTENHAIRKIDLGSRQVTTLAGNGKQGTATSGGVGREATLSSPWDITQLGDTLYIATAGVHQIWTLDLQTLHAAPYAGTSQESIVDGPLRQAVLAQPSGITTDGKDLYFADSEASAVRMAGAGGIRTIIGKGLFDFGDVDGSYPAARLQHPIGITYHDGLLYVADTYNDKIREVDPAGRTISTLVGTGSRGSADGPAKQASLNEPSGLAWVGGKLYIADTNNQAIRVFDPATGAVHTLTLTNTVALMPAPTPSFVGNEISVPLQTVAPGTVTLKLAIRLPAGTKFNPQAPFSLSAASDKPDSITVSGGIPTAPSAVLAIPLIAKSGDATVTVDVNVNYCKEGNEGLCYFKEARLRIPLHVAQNGGAAASAELKL